MPLIFNGKSIPGAYQPISIPSPAMDTIRTKFFGVRGESEIRPSIPTGARGLSFWCLVFDKNIKTLNDMVSFLKQLDASVGAQGTLEVKTAGGDSELFQNCTFDSYQRQAFPLLDIGGTLGGGYWVPITMNFFQRVVKRQ